MTRKSIISLAIIMLSMTQAVAGSYEYVPFVREGVKWVYYCYNPIADYDESGFTHRHYCTLEIKGDTLIEGQNYKPMHLYSGKGISEGRDTVPVYLREQNKVVYGIIPDERRYWECPIGLGSIVLNNRLSSSIETGKEFILYDFNNLEYFYENYNAGGRFYVYYPLIDEEFVAQIDTVLISGQPRKRLFISGPYGPLEQYIIEGIGFAGGIGGAFGTPLNYFYARFVSLTQVTNVFSHVIENGVIVYKSENYREADDVDEVAVDRTLQTLDPNYYDLTGRNVGAKVPTVAGIYIHNGKKIIVR